MGHLVCQFALQHTAHSTQHTAHSTQYTVYSTQYTVHSTQYTVHYTLYTPHTVPIDEVFEPLRLLGEATERMAVCLVCPEIPEGPEKLGSVFRRILQKKKEKREREKERKSERERESV